MKIYELESTLSVPVSLRDAFEFFENPRNLARITPPGLNLRLPPGRTVEMRQGAEICYRIHWLGLPINWETRIAEYEPPFFFVDVQAAGPYAYWRHRHEFRPGEYGTIVADHVQYALPFGPLGRLAHRLLVRKQLREIFAYRQRALAEILSSAPTVK